MNLEYLKTLATERHESKPWRTLFCEYVPELVAEIERLRGENAQMREALEHYSNAQNWAKIGRVVSDYDDVWLHNDGYDLARQALDSIKTEAGE